MADMIVDIHDFSHGTKLYLYIGLFLGENIVPFVIGTTAAGFVFGIFLLILSLCLFYKTKVKDSEIDWVHDNEPSDWVRNVQSIGIVNNGHHFESRLVVT